MPTAPAPFHILRNHSTALSALSINPSNTLLYSGDQDGYVGITDLSSRRVVQLWQAHTGSILSVEEWNGHLISHGRDNKIKMYEPIRLSGRLGQGMDKSKGLEVIRELDVNALNFCRFSIASPPSSVNEKGKGKEAEGILVVPSLLDSEYADIYHLPTFKRIHSSFSYVPILRTPGASSSRTGLIMSIHSCIAADGEGSERIKVAMGYEDGRVEVWALQDGLDWRTPTDARTGPSSWDRLYKGKKHNEAVMAMVITSNLTRAWTVSADHQLVSYDLTSTAESTKVWSTGHIGHASLAISPNEQVVAVGGWDGHIRLFSAATGKPLGDLDCHRESVHVVAFAHLTIPDQEPEVESTVELGEEDDGDCEELEGGKRSRERWLVSGSKDRRVGLWELMDFTHSARSP